LCQRCWATLCQCKPVEVLVRVPVDMCVCAPRWLLSLRLPCFRRSATCPSGTRPRRSWRLRSTSSLARATGASTRGMAPSTDPRSTSRCDDSTSSKDKHHSTCSKDQHQGATIVPVVKINIIVPVVKIDIKVRRRARWGPSCSATRSKTRGQL